MKRARKEEDDIGTEYKLRMSGTAHVKQPKSASTALEEVRAKLEQARLKKIAAEERLLRQRQHESIRLQQQMSVPPPSSTKISATTTMTSDISGRGTTTLATNQKIDNMKSLEGIVSNLSSNGSIRAKKAQEALDRARSKLQGALQNRERALQQQRINNASSTYDSSSGNTSNFIKSSNTNTSWNRKRWTAAKQNYFSYKQQGRNVADSGLPPISALSQTFDLRIINIDQSGPPSTVYHNEDCVDLSLSSIGRLGSRTELIAALGGDEVVEALHQGSDWCYTSDEEWKNERADATTDGIDLKHQSRNETLCDDRKKPAVATTKNKPKLTSTSLLQRKLQLQNELIALKEMLEIKVSQEPKQKQQSQNQDTVNTNILNGDSGSKEIPTKEGLERRKAEAQTMMDISYWKHFVSKQEHLLEQVTSKINDMDSSSNPRGTNTYQECLNKRHATNKAIAKVQQDLDVIEKRHEVVEQGIAITTERLLKSRQDLHQARNRERVQE